jgi:hypothetical protein
LHPFLQAVCLQRLPVPVRTQKAVERFVATAFENKKTAAFGSPAVF